MKCCGSPMTVLAAGTAIAAALVLGTVGAQQSREADIRMAFAAADANRDGGLDVNEFVANAIYLFRQMDDNRDGHISLQEWSTHVRGPSADSFRAADRNGDGKISVGEAVAGKMIEFFDTDANRDGVITIDELLAYERSVPVATVRK
jgi:Ca2+-binding EF-hand superfamily protein